MSATSAFSAFRGEDANVAGTSEAALRPGSLPGPSEGAWWLRAPIRLALRACLTLVATAIVAVPILVAIMLHLEGLRVAAQHEISTTIPGAQIRRWRSAGESLPAFAPPIVIAYHGISPPGSRAEQAESAGRYVISPRLLDAQLTALRAAGYRTISAGRLDAYLHGGPMPARSVLLTFDGGGQGLWTFADRILARHGMRGVAFIDDRMIGTDWGRFLSWSEIQDMLADRRWDLEPLATSTPPFALGARLSSSVEAFADHRLGQPSLVALPTPTATQAPSPDRMLPGALRGGSGATAFANGQSLGAPFAAAFVNSNDQLGAAAVPAGPGQLVGRIEVTGRIAPSQLLARVISETQIPVPEGPPSRRAGQWMTARGTAAAVSASGSTVRLTGTGHYVYAAYAPDATAAWDDYLVSVTINQLTAKHSGAALFVRVGTDHTVAVNVGTTDATVLEQTPAGTVVRARWRLFPGRSHHVSIMVRRGETTLAIDRLVSLALPVRGSWRSSGGIALSVMRPASGAASPSFSDLTVVRRAVTGHQAAILPLIPVSSHPPLSDPALWVSAGSSARVSASGTQSQLRFVGARTYSFSEFAPVQTARWLGYMLTATATGLPYQGSAQFVGRVGSRQAVIAVVGRHWVRVFSGGAPTRSSRRLIASRPLPASTTHVVSLKVLAGRTLVYVDGLPVAAAAAARGSTGGIALAARRLPSEAWPQIVNLSISPVK